MGLLFDATDHHDRFPEVGLSMASGMIERNEHLPVSPPMFPNVVLDDGVAALEPVLITEPFENPLGRMPLLARPLPILRKPLIDDPGEPVQLRALDRR